MVRSPKGEGERDRGLVRVSAAPAERDGGGGAWGRVEAVEAARGREEGLLEVEGARGREKVGTEDWVRGRRIGGLWRGTSGRGAEGGGGGVGGISIEPEG